VAAQLMPGERAIVLTRQHWSVVAPQLVASAVVVAAVLVAVALLPSRIASVDANPIRAAVAAIALVFVLWYAGTQYLRWRFRTYLLTDRRVVVESGVLSRSVESIALDRIQNTVIRRPLGDRVIGAGDIEIESAGRDGVEVLHRIPNAPSFYTELLSTIEGWRRGGGGPPTAGC